MIGVLAPSSAAEPPGPSSGAVRDSHIAAELVDVAVSGGAYDQAVATTARIQANLAANEAQVRDATARIESSIAEQARLTRAITEDEKIKADADRSIETLRTQLRHLALQAYVGADDQSSALAALSLDTGVYLASRTAITLRRAVTRTSHDRYVQEVAVSTAAAARLRLNRAGLVQATADFAAARTDADDARRAIVRGRTDLGASLIRLRDARALAVVDGTDLPLVVLDAYVHAARIARLITPGCHLSWTLLAGIGSIESGQGTHGGASVRQDGTLTRPIVGIPLDGSNETEVIRDPAGGYLRALGPMQFLPTTWARVAVDGDGDGATDIQNLYDAAASAGAYLCRDGRDLASPGDLRTAILSYNFSGAYVGKVTAAMAHYAEALPNVPAR